MSTYANGTRVVWTSNTGRRRKASVVTAMKASHHYLVRVLDGLPGEIGTHHVLPPARLSIDKDPA